MKIVGIIAALALATAPMLAASQDSDSVPDEQVAVSPEPGGVSQSGSLDVFSLSSIPAGALVIGGVVILAGVIVGVVASEDSTVSTTN